MTTITKQNNRLLSLDIFRGITIAGMILVNNPGSWSHIYAPLAHVSWNGLTPTDLVFPFFMFIMGVSTFMALRKYDFQPTKACLGKIVYRTVMIFLIGLALNWFGGFCQGLASGNGVVAAASNLENLRIPGVLQRLALAYGFASFIIVFLRAKHLLWAIGTLLIGYFFLLVFGHGFEQSENNIIAVIDKAIFGANHLYLDWDGQGNRVVFDPEGLLSTIPSIAHVLIGFLFGMLLVDIKDNHKRVEKLMIWGTVLAFAGLLLMYGCPINKKIWSPTFVLLTCGFSAQLLALLIWIIDINGKVKWSRFFHSFGVNPLFIYVVADMLAKIFGNLRFSYGEGTISVSGFMYHVLLKPWAGNYFGSFLYAIVFVTICWTIGYVLYKRNIYIKL